MIRATREWFSRVPMMMLSATRPDPVFDAVRKHQLALDRETYCLWPP